MARPRGELTRCGGRWTEAQFRAFVKNNLRSASRKWQPIQACKKNAHVSRGVYRCEGCGQEVPPTYYDEESRKRMKNIFVDHIVPVVDPAVGWTTWDDCIDRLFCEPSNLQLLCKSCHKEKSVEEIAIASERRRFAKQKEDQFEDEDFSIEEE